MRHELRWMPGMIALALVLSGATASAQGTGAGSIYDPSIRAAGMGGVASAVFWDDANVWANPALLGYAQGMRFERGRSQLVPGLATDVWFDTERWTFGGGGLGVGWAGQPGGMGRTFLDYGDGANERVASWSIGASAVGLAQTVAGWRGAQLPAFTSYADVAFGVTRKDLKVALAPGVVNSASTSQRDWGALARVTPLDNARSGARPNLPVRLDLAYGYSVLNTSDARVTFINEDQAVPVTRVYFNGFSARGVMGLPAAAKARFGRAAWLAESFEPLVSLGGSWDFEHVQAGSDASQGYDVRHVGVELALANIVTLRTGHLEDKKGEISGSTVGWGLGTHIGRYAGFRYDYGTRPQSSGLPDVKRRGWTAFIDIAALARAGNPS